MLSMTIKYPDELILVDNILRKITERMPRNWFRSLPFCPSLKSASHARGLYSYLTSNIVIKLQLSQPQHGRQIHLG